MKKHKADELDNIRHEKNIDITFKQKITKTLHWVASIASYYRAMHYSAYRGIAIVILSV